MFFTPKDDKSAEMIKEHTRRKHGNKKTQSNSILNSKNEVPSVSTSEEDGVDYINISKHANSPLGKALWLGAGIKTHTILGTMRNIKHAMDYMKTIGYNADFVRKEKLTKTEYNAVPRGPGTLTDPDNFWAIVTYLVLCRISQDVKLVKALKELDPNIVITSFNIEREKGMLNAEILNFKYNERLGRYLSIIRHIVDAIREDRFDHSFARSLVRDAKDAPELDLFTGVAFEAPEELNEETVMLDLTEEHDAEDDNDGLPDEDMLDEESRLLEGTGHTNTLTGVTVTEFEQA